LKQLSKNGLIGEQAGSAAREHFGLSPAHPFDDLLRTLERATPVDVILRPWGEGGLDGAFSLVRDRPFLLVNSSKAPVRQRFTLAHEFGHYFLDHGSTFDVYVNWGDNDPKETQANFFAASFLMPRAGIVDEVTRINETLTFEHVVDLAALFGVSVKAMRIRLETFDLIGGKQIKDFDERIANEEHYGRAFQLQDTLAATRGGSRMPSEMTARAIRGVASKLLPTEEAAEILRTGPKSVYSLLAEQHAIAE
jgi:Zn-dependent peptidase ImmA (M78 family)